MEWVIIGLLLGFFFFVIVPWAAFRASGRSTAALDQIVQLKSELAALREELEGLKGGGTGSAAGS